MLRRTIRGLWQRACAFATDRSASVTVDFIVSIPILLGVLVLTTEYGKILNTRTVLDNAVADATRYLTRAPRDASGDFYPASVQFAQEIVRNRFSTDLVAVSAPAITTVDGFDVVTLEAAVGVASPALGVLSLASPGGKLSDGTPLNEIEGFVIVAGETFRYFGR